VDSLTEAVGVLVLILVAVVVVLWLLAAILHAYGWLRRELHKLRRPEPYEVLLQRQREMGQLR
jgi:uncharacterized membrane-anchored protein